ncbi:MAG: Lrp/AsnC family transcriptional regulator [Halobacteriota archaeon]|nr:Lrp/AsnC family transcriptional regulator [Halobacteriota archaeon]
MTKRGINLDEKDRKIMTLLSDNPDISQDEIAREVGLSQPSVAMRLKKLRESGAIVNVSGVNPLKIGFYLAKVDFTTDNTTKILDTFKDCPYFLNGFIVSGRNNMSLLFVGDDISTLEAIVDYHLRALKEVQNVDFNIIIGVAKDLVMPMKMNVEKSDMPPCGIDFNCKDCTIHGDRCMGCPVTGHYRGSLW